MKLRIQITIGKEKRGHGVGTTGVGGSLHAKMVSLCWVGSN